jgi:hypothetical protein
MPGETQDDASSPLLSERIERLRKEVVSLVRSGAEHGRCELTRACSIAKESAKSRIDFVKMIQGLANAHLREERYLVIGADRKEQRFYPVDNCSEFDPAAVSQLLQKYLNPAPLIETFDFMKTEEGTAFVLVVVSSSQPRPIVVKADGADNQGALLFRRGDVWIKKDTRLDLATREDLEAMYAERIEYEGEARARSRFAHFRDEIIAVQQLNQPSVRRIPTRELVYGPDDNFRLYIEGLIADQDATRFSMVVELLRELLVEGWHLIDAYQPSGDFRAADYRPRVSKHKRDIFLPAMRRLVELGLLLIKHSTSVASFSSLADLLVEIFQSSHRLSGLLLFDGTPVQDYLARSMPRLETLLGARALCSYAIKRGRYEFLPPLLKKYVLYLPPGTSKRLAPLCFWPIRLNVPNDRLAFCWESGVSPFWKSYFGSEAAYLDAACQYEFLMHFNCYMATEVMSPKRDAWLKSYGNSAIYSYFSDIWRYSLDRIVPLAEKIYAAIQRGSGDMLLHQISVEKSILDACLGGMDTPQDLDFFPGYLADLTRWQAQACVSANRFPPDCDWGPLLGPKITDVIAKSKRAGQW